MSSGQLIFMLLIFATVFLLVQGLVVPVFGESAQASKRLKKRLAAINEQNEDDSYSSLLRKRYLKQLKAPERFLEELPAMESLATLIEQAGYTILAYRLVLMSLSLGVVAGYLSWAAFRMPWATVLATVFLTSLPILKMRGARAKRMAKFEEQLPDAIDIMKRALKAGHPFNGTLKLVADDMDDPVAHEFALTFNEISYGNDVRRALLGLLSRIPSVTVMALVTSILVQKETGGNLAEVLEQISKVIRGRFRFHRKVKTLTAEGRMSAWVLATVPLFLFATIWITTPDYLPILIEDPRGHKLIIYGAISGVIGIAWIRRIIRIEV
jgi:tight adherence protein B